MSANLVILSPHYLFSGNKVSFSIGESNHSESNIVTGSRATFFRGATAEDSCTFIVDLDALDEAERAPDYLYIAGLNLSIKKGGLVNVELNGDDASDFSGSTLACGQADVDLTDLVGRNQEDFIIETTDSYTKRYWMGRIENGTGTSNFKYEFRKMYFGQWFDPIVEPDAPAMQKISPVTGQRRHLRSFSLQWYGLSNEKLKEFTDKILVHRRYNPVILYARDWDGLLNNERLVHAQITSFELTRIKHDFNRIKVEFMEVI